MSKRKNKTNPTSELVSYKGFQKHVIEVAGTGYAGKDWKFSKWKCKSLNQKVFVAKAANRTISYSTERQWSVSVQLEPWEVHTISIIGYCLEDAIMQLDTETVKPFILW